LEWVRAAELFTNVVNLGSLSAAGRHCGVSPATVSRIIRALEEDVGARLLNRTSRQLNLTEAGQLYYNSVEHILQQIQEANEGVAGLQSAPQGKLRVHSRILIGNKYVVPALPEFMRQYPEISIDLMMSNFPVDLVAQNIDVDIRIGKLEDSSLIARKLANSQRLICATREYLDRSPPLQHPADLRMHNCLTYRLTRGRSVWRFSSASEGLTEVAVTGSLQSDNGQALLAAMINGQGIAIMPDWAVRDEIEAGKLVRLFPDHQVSHGEFENGVYAVFQQSRQVPAKVRVFIDYFAAHFKDRLGHL
jgi:DNA-binding transcriptional LysR family regulator